MQKIENLMFIVSVISMPKIFSENCLSPMQNSVAYLSCSKLCKCFPSALSCKQGLGQDLGYRNVSRS